MAGSNNLYLEPIINGAVGDMGTNLAAMNTQLSETTRILMNILNNQGLQQHQSAYGGATFSALTLSTDTAEKYNFSAEPMLSGYGYTVNGVPTSDNTITLSGTGAACKMIMTGGSACDLSNVTEITVDVASGDHYFSISFVDENDTTTTLTPVASSGYKKFTLTLPAENRQVYKKIIFNYIILGNTVKVNYTGGTFVFTETAHLAFNANNLLTWATTSSALALYDESKTAYITIPDVQGVASWVSAVLKGNLDGISIALVDNTSHDLIKVLPTATSDISDVQELSGLALMVTFAGDGNSLKYMSGFSMRYY